MTDKIKKKIEWVKPTNFLAGLALFFASLFFFYDLLGGKYLLAERDLGPYFIPPRFFWVESIKHGNFPLWNPFQFSGHPFFANPQHAVVYPFNSLFFLLPFDIAFNTIIVLHFFMGGLFTYSFLRDLKVNPTGSLISGLIFMLSGYLLSVHSLLTILLSSVWTPLILMFFRRAILKPGFRNEVFTAIFVTFSFLGGGIEIVYGNFFVLLIMVIFSPSPTIEFVGDKPRRYKFLYIFPVYWKRIRSLFIVSILFLSLSAIQLLPFLELFHHSIRGSGMSYQEATTWSFAPKDVLLFFLPDAYGYFLDMKKYWVSQCWFKTLYAGGLPFILSAIFLIFGRGRRLYLALILFSLFLSLGKYNPLYPFVFKYVPFFNGIRYPAKFLYIFILVLSITAGLGFQRLSELSKGNEKKRLKRLILVFSLVFGSVLLFSALGHQQVEHFLKLKGIDSPDFNILAVNLHHAQRFLFYLALFFLLLRVGYEVRWKGWVKVLLLVFLMTDLFGNMGFYGKEKTEDYFRKTKALETISSDRDFFRLFSTAKTISQDTTIIIEDPTSLNILKEKSLPTMNLLFRLHDIWGIDVIRVKRADDLYKAFTNTPSISATHLIDLYGVKYITSVTPLEENNKFELIYARLENLQGKREDLLKENTIKLYKNRRPLPRAWLVKDFRVMDSGAMLSRMTSKDFRPGREVLLEEDPKWTNPPTPPRRRQSGYGASATFTQGGLGGLNVGEPLSGLPQKVQIMSESNNRLVLQVEVAEDSLLVLSDTYYPGWKAFVDGKETRIYRADYAFRAISLNSGTHQVEFVYDPISFKLGAGVTILGILGCLGIGWVVRQKSSSRSGTS
ncbi:MAG: hypothetical protein A2157_09215 [Deltaproteobacteria bacterium RBG_16_47_11]|nr:MAG: hypothetical protein A2157_09215 [Deltaproteobacteria bacterium RBG_16_47_11]